MPIQFPDGDSFIIRDVWSSNVDQEFAIIRGIVDKFPYIAMDTEFPGIIVSHVGGTPDVNYKTLRSNVNPLKLIQLGLTFSDEHGNHPTVTVTDDSSSSSSSSGSSKKKNQGEKFCVWQFNFREFNVKSDVYAPDSIQLLIKSGIDFKRNMRDGIDVRRFGELLSASGAVRNDRIHWVTFHSAYDFGYLLKLLKGEDLPETKEGFFELMNLYFPRVYDMKYLMRFCNNLFGGLDKLAELLEVRRIGVRHLAGSDSLLTCHSFLRMKEKYFSDSLVQYRGVLFGLGSGASGTDASGGGSSTGGASGGGGSSGGASGGASGGGGSSGGASGGASSH